MSGACSNRSAREGARNNMLGFFAVIPSEREGTPLCGKNQQTWATLNRTESIAVSKPLTTMSSSFGY